MTSVSKNVDINELADIVNKYNNIYHSTIKMKPADVKLSTYIDFNKEINKEGPNFEIGDHLEISKHKKLLAKSYTLNWSEEDFVTKKVKNTVPWTYVIGDLNGEESFGTLYEKELQKTNQKIKKGLELKK